MKLSHRITLVSLLLFITQLVSAQQLTLSNNLLYDATLTPNLRMGLRLSPQWSMGVTAGFRPWPADDEVSRKWKHLLLSPDVRYWTDSVGVHHFFGFNLIYSHYNVADVKFPFGLWKSVRNERRQGDLGALGAYYGYSWPLGRYWNVEVYLGAALGYTWFNRYKCGHCGMKLGKDRKLFVMPQAGLSLVYNIPARPRQQAEPVMTLQPLEEEPVKPVAEKPFVPALTPVPAVTPQLPEDNMVANHISDYRPYDRTRILRKEKEVLLVHFAVGKSQLSPTYRNNQQTLERIIKLTRQMATDTVLNVRKIQIVGFASVEGNPAVNERLAEKRALALQQYIQQQVNVPDEVFETVGGGEAWAEFRDYLEDLVAKGSQPNIRLDKVIEIIDQETDNKVRERRIKQLDGGRSWAYISQHILKDQRNSGYVHIYYDYAPDKAAAVINEASELLTTDCSDCHHEALRLLQTVRDDERAQNALGTALWLCGQREEALKCFRRAAAQGNADAKENLRTINEQYFKN